MLKGEEAEVRINNTYITYVSYTNIFYFSIFFFLVTQENIGKGQRWFIESFKW